MNIPVSQFVNTVGSGGTSTSPFITIITNRAPTTYDVNYQVTQRWVNNAGYLTANITGATNANPCVITADNFFQAGQLVKISGVGGMTQLNNNSYPVLDATGSNFTINVDSTGFGTYTSGGIAVANVVEEYILLGFTSAGGTVQANWAFLAQEPELEITLTGNTGGPVPPDAEGNFNVVGDGTTIDIVGNPSTNTLTASVIGGVYAESFIPDSGTSPVVPNAMGEITTHGVGSFTVVGGTNTLNFELTGLTNHAVLVGAGTATITKVGPTATSGQVLQSQGSTTDPAFSTATYPSTTTINEILYSSANNVVGQITAADNGVLISGTTGVPSWLANSGTPGYVLTANSSLPPSWQSASASGAVTTLDGDTGSATPTAGVITIKSNVASLNSGQSVSFVGSGSTLTLNLTSAHNSTFLGNLSGNVSVSENNNTAVGYSTLTAVTGSVNTAIGGMALVSVTSGSENTCIGYSAGSSYTSSEQSNILIGYSVTGTLGESHVCRIGTDTGTGGGGLTKTFIAGITGATPTSGNTPQVVLCDNTNQLTVISSSTSGYVLTSNGSSTPSFQSIGAAGAVTTIDGDSGSCTPSSGTVTISGGSTGLTTSGSSHTLSLTGTLALANGGTNASLTATANNLVYSTASAFALLSTANNGVLVTSGTGAPSIGSTLPSAVQGNITTVGTVTSGTWQGSVIGPTYGGTGVNNGSLTITLGSGHSGYVLTSDSSGNATWQSNPGSTGFSSVHVQVFTYTGMSQTYTPTSGMVYCTIVCVAGGGGGGGSAAATNMQTGAAGGGGGGETGIKTVAAGTIGASQTVTVGGGGSGGSGNSAGSGGGNSSVGSIVSADGGSGGSGSGVGAPYLASAGGAGGTGGSGGDVQIAGGGGGGGFAALSVGVAISTIGGAGGSSYYGGGAAAVGGNGAFTTGNNGGNYGGGGGGATTYNSGSGTGGNGANGVVYIFEYID